MKYKLSKEDSLILRLFVEREVPDFICEIVIDNINLSEHYEELFNYSIAVLDGTDVEFGKNASGTDRAFVFAQQYKDVLIELMSSLADPDWLVHVSLCFAVLENPQKVPACIADKPSKQTGQSAKGILLRQVYPDKFEPGRSA